MFHRISGFISEIDLDDTADVFIYLLFPQKFSPYLEDGLFSHFRQRLNFFRSEANDATVDKYGLIHDHYAPFSMPLKGRFSRDCGVYLDREYNPILIEWIEGNFNVNLTDYFENLSSRTHPNKVDIINEKNIFDFMSVAFEHESFIRKVTDFTEKDPEIYLGYDLKSHFFKSKDLTMIQGLVSGDNMSLILKQFDQTQLIKNAKVIEHNSKYYVQRMYQDLVEMELLEFFLIRTNKVYKPSSRGGQRCSRTYIDLLDNARKETCDELFNAEEEC